MRAGYPFILVRTIPALVGFELSMLPTDNYLIAAQTKHVTGRLPDPRSSRVAGVFQAVFIALDLGL